MGEKNTKQKILDAALDLFSTQGYEATSIAQITEAVGIRKASLYSHFSGKQEILNTLLQNTMKQYEEHSIFTQVDWNDPKAFREKEFTPEETTKMILGHVQFLLHAPYIGKGRKLLILEQFQNKELAALQTKQSYSNIMNFFTGFMRFLVNEKKLTEKDPEIMAAQLCLPVSVWINLCDREPEREDEIMKLIEKHVRQFFEMYQVKPKEAMNSENNQNTK